MLGPHYTTMNGNGNGNGKLDTLRSLVESNLVVVENYPLGAYFLIAVAVSLR